MTHWLARAADLIGENEPLILATVCGVEGSAPREAGAKMIVTHDREWGTIGGGALEFAALARARAMLADGSNDILFDDFPLGPALGQCCGGRVRILYERLGPQDLEWLQRAGKIMAQDGSVVLERGLANVRGGVVRRRVRRNDRAERDTRAAAFLDGDGVALAQSFPPPEKAAAIRETVADYRARVFIFGAGHVGTAIVGVLQTMPAAVTWIDRRADIFPAATGDNVTAIRTDDETGAAAAAPAGACYFVLTHDHQLDYNLIAEILKRGDSAYCGLIGSKTKRARFERRLKRAGVDTAALARLSCPIGDGELESKSPAVIALSATHEMFIAHQAHAKDHRNWN